MKHAIRVVCALTITLLPVPAMMCGQTCYPLTPDTRGNRIELTVANVSATLSEESIIVQVTRVPSHLKFTSAHQTIPFIPPAKEGVVVFTFDVDRTAPPNRKDTIEFFIRDRMGATWMKSMSVQYSGPTAFALDQNFPNPFNPSTMIYFQLPKDSRVSLKVYDILGRQVADLVNEDRPAGYHEARFDAGNVAGGVYFYRMEAKAPDDGLSFQQIRKMMVVK